MSSVSPNTDFTDRRQFATNVPPVIERRQFTNSYEELSPEARELARAIDEYKLRHRRRFINYEELLGVVQAIGYSKKEATCSNQCT